MSPTLKAHAGTQSTGNVAERVEVVANAKKLSNLQRQGTDLAASTPGQMQRLFCSNRSFLEFVDWHPACDQSIAQEAISDGKHADSVGSDRRSILHFRHLLEKHRLGEGLLEEINAHLASQGLRLRQGTVVDATIIEAPASTKNRAGQRDPEMRQVKKGNAWHFGMKLHIGADAQTGLVHSFTTTPASVHDVTQAGALLHGGEQQVWGDAGYVGVQKRPEHQGRAVTWQVALRPGQRRRLTAGSAAALAEQRKASVRAKVEHPFLWVKRRFGYATVRYRGLHKNTQRLALLLGLTNLVTAARYVTA